MSIIQGTSKSSAAAAYEISQSIRFNFSDGAHMLRTPSTASNRRTWTWSLWVKRSGLGNPGGPNQVHQLFGVGAGSCLRFTPSDQLRLESPAGNHTFVTSQVFRDTSAWYHIVLAFDSTQATDTDRRKLYVNGSQVTDFSSTTFTGLAQNAEWDINSTSQHQIAKSNLADYFGGYLAELNFVDGQALAPTDFGETNADTGQWVPVRYAGSYGTNGFYLKGQDSSNLGDDSSGNNNDFTSSGLTAADQVSDSPTDNFSTMNALGSGFAVAGSIADGNLQVTTGTAIEGEWYFGTQRLQGNVYWEVYINSIGNSRLWCGVGIDGDDYAHAASDHWMIYSFNGTFYDQGSAGKTSSAISATSTLQFAFSEDNDALWVGVDGTWLYSATQAEIEAFTTTNKANSTSFGGVDLFPVVGTGSSTNVVTYNFGQTAFTHTKPTGYSAVSTANLPDPTIADPSAYFQTTTYAGTGSTRSVDQSGNSTFEPGFVWIKARDAAYDHALYDQVRGATEELKSNASSAESTISTGLTAFESDGFQVGSRLGVNDGTKNFAAWQWAADGTSGSSNTDGSITSTVSANTTSGFSIVSYTGTGANATVGHGLGAVGAPKMIIIKNRPDVDNWIVYHEAMGATKGLSLNNTAAPTTAITYFNNTAPTSSVFSIGSGGGTNGSGDAQIAYCFAEVENFSKLGSYIGNGSTDGSFVYTAFRPAFVILKRTNTAQEWQLYDSERDPINVANHKLEPNSSSAESILTTDNNLDFLSNGFKLRKGNGGMNASGSTYIYMAFAESPFKTATAR
jgi:hypothetical protein